MKSVLDWLPSYKQGVGNKVLLLGKGPTFAKRSRYDLEKFDLTIGLNHVVREMPVDLAHIIDLEVVEHCGQALYENAEFLVMPWIPHIRRKLPFSEQTLSFKPGSMNLDECCEQIPLLGKLRSEGRLLYYNLGTAPADRTVPGIWVLPPASFSAAVVLQMMAYAGVRYVRTLGIDGGSGYAGQFDDLKETTHLAAGQASYDAQFSEIARVIMNADMDFSPLDVDSPITIFVGTQPEQMLAFKVLEYSIKKHSSMSVKVVPLHEAAAKAGIVIPEPRDPKNRPRTPFSFQRFAIPALMNYRGRAIYVDSDMQVFRDMRELWTWPFNGAEVLAIKEPEESGRRPQFSVMMMDCAALRWDVADLVAELDKGTWSYEQLVYDMAAAPHIRSDLPETWNELERYSENRTSLLHYTDMDTQPWLSTENVLGHVWCKDLFEAIHDNVISRSMVEEHVEKGWVRPSLVYQLDHAIVDPLLVPGHVKRRDMISYVPPHVRGEYGRPLPWGGRTIRRVYASSRFFWNNTGLPLVYKRLAKKLRQFLTWLQR